VILDYESDCPEADDIFLFNMLL